MTFFNVNTNICKIYCSDSVDYYLPARGDVNGSLQLKYDIESWVFNERSINELSRLHYLAIFIKSARLIIKKLYKDDTVEFEGIQYKVTV